MNETGNWDTSTSTCVLIEGDVATEAISALMKCPGVRSVSREHVIVITTEIERSDRESRLRVYDAEAKLIDRFPTTTFDFRCREAVKR